MVERGRALAAEHAPLLARIEAEYGVPRRFILAIWGMESQFGRITGGVPVFQALATLAWDPRRAEFFRGEIFAALRIVANGDITVPAMTGSWAGAMGQSQFLPSSYLQLAVDADGDGRRDIWKSTADSLGSIANYLRSYGVAARVHVGTRGADTRRPGRYDPGPRQRRVPRHPPHDRASATGRMAAARRTAHVRRRPAPG